MELDVTSLTIGIIIGSASAFLIRVYALKSLSLKLTKLGIGLGVEGFPETKSGGGINIGGDFSGNARDIVGRDKNTRYGPRKTLNQSLESLISKVENITPTASGYEQQSRLYKYNYGKDNEVQVIHEDIEQSMREGWFVTNITTLEDYDSKNRLWVILTRPTNNKIEAGIRLRSYQR